MEFLILVLVVVGFYKMNQKSNEYKETADKAQSQLNAYVKANQTAESIIKNAAQLSSQVISFMKFSREIFQPRDTAG